MIVHDGPDCGVPVQMARIMLLELKTGMFRSEISRYITSNGFLFELPSTIHS